MHDTWPDAIEWVALMAAIVAVVWIIRRTRG